MTTRKIDLLDTTNWGALEATDAEREAYEAAVAEAIAAVFPGVEVTVQCSQREKPLAIVTTRDDDGRILTDTKTVLAEERVAETVLEIARDVWELGNFWPEVES